MAIYNENDTRFKGSVDVTANTVIPVLVDTAGVITADDFPIDRTAKMAFQLSSANLSAGVDCALEVSLDGTNWSPALDESGTAITLTLISGTPYANSFNGIKGMLVRVSMTVALQTGDISYIFRNHATA